MSIAFTTGLNQADPAATYFALMLDAGIDVTADLELVDLLPFESTATDYARAADFTAVETIDDDRLEARLDADGLVGNNLEFGALVADDEQPQWIVIVRKITDDTDSIALYAHEIDAIGGNAIRENFPAVHVSSRGFMKSKLIGSEV